MKKLMMLAAMLAMVLVAAVPVIAQVANEFDDQPLESGSYESETEIAIDGNNNNQCTGLLQFGQTGNSANQQGTTQYDNPESSSGFGGPSLSFAPENATECEQAVQQSAAASSWGW